MNVTVLALLLQVIYFSYIILYFFVVIGVNIYHLSRRRKASSGSYSRYESSVIQLLSERQSPHLSSSMSGAAPGGASSASGSVGARGSLSAEEVELFKSLLLRVLEKL